MKKIILCGFIFFGVTGSALAQGEAKTILSKAVQQCRSLQSGSYSMKIERTSFQGKAVNLDVKCFFAYKNDSLFPWKFYTDISNGTRTICGDNMLIQMKSSDSSATIYLEKDDPKLFVGAGQTEGLFPPFFAIDAAFLTRRWKESTFILRQKEEKTIDGKNCYQVQMIDASKTAQRVEKLFFIDKESFLPVQYSEFNVIKLEKDSLVNQITYTLNDVSFTKPADSLFSYKNVPSHFKLKNTVPVFYHHHLKAGAKAPFFTASTLEREKISVPASGKKYLLFFMDLSSYPALKSLKALHEIKNSNKNVEVIMIAMDERQRDLKEIIARRNISLKTIADVSDSTSIAKNYYISASPTYLLVNSKGVIKAIETGFGDATLTRLQKEIETLD